MKKYLFSLFFVLSLCIGTVVADDEYGACYHNNKPNVIYMWHYNPDGVVHEDVAPKQYYTEDGHSITKEIPKLIATTIDLTKPDTPDFENIRDLINLKREVNTNSGSIKISYGLHGSYIEKIIEKQNKFEGNKGFIRIGNNEPEAATCFVRTSLKDLEAKFKTEMNKDLFKQFTFGALRCMGEAMAACMGG